MKDCLVPGPGLGLDQQTSLVHSRGYRWCDLFGGDRNRLNMDAGSQYRLSACF